MKVFITGFLLAVAPNAEKVPSTWQNPHIGLTVDAVADAHDAADSWKSPGLTIRGTELIVSSNIDPYASLVGNVLISQQGAELHEAFAEFPVLPLNLKLKGGLMLANFGRWNRFHTHAMPFSSEPRVYREYAGGMMALRGIASCRGSFLLSRLVTCRPYPCITPAQWRNTCRRYSGNRSDCRNVHHTAEYRGKQLPDHFFMERRQRIF
jgi:hypothetical protein